MRNLFRQLLRGTTLAIAHSLLMLTTTACSGLGEPTRECAHGDGYCKNGMAYRCQGFQSHYGGGGTRWEGTRCRDQNHCQVDDEGGYCTLTDRPDEDCKGHSYCDGPMQVVCRSGFPIKKASCATCSEEKGCEGGWSDDCNSPRVCGDGLVCVTTNRFRACSTRCDCEEGSRCSSCDAAGGDATSEWICSSNVCKARGY